MNPSCNPTANLQFNSEKVIPKNGVYVTKVNSGGLSYQSVTNIGFNPTFESEKVINIETHIFDFNKDIYGEQLEVIFYTRLRDEKKFNSVNELISQIKDDSQKAQKFFK